MNEAAGPQEVKRDKGWCSCVNLCIQSGTPAHGQKPFTSRRGLPTSVQPQTILNMCLRVVPNPIQLTIKISLMMFVIVLLMAVALDYKEVLHSLLSLQKPDAAGSHSMVLGQ